MRKLLCAAGLIFCTFGYGQQDSSKNSIALTHEQNHFDKQFADPWYTTSLQYKKNLGFGTALARVNYATRYGQNGLQYEMDAYPKLGDKMYAYFNIGYSNDLPVFSKWRNGMNLFYSLGQGWEATAGYRYLYFDDAVWRGTIGASKYAGSWLLNARSFFSFDQPFNNLSVFFDARKYFRNDVDYFWFLVGRGISPDENRNVQLNTTQQLTSTRLGAGIRYSIAKSFQLQLSAGWSRDEFRVDEIGNQFSGGAGIEFKF